MLTGKHLLTLSDFISEFTLGKRPLHQKPNTYRSFFTGEKAPIHWEISQQDTINSSLLVPSGLLFLRPRNICYVKVVEIIWIISWSKRKITFNLNGNFKEKSILEMEFFKHLPHFFPLLWGCILSMRHFWLPAAGLSPGNPDKQGMLECRGRGGGQAGSWLGCVMDGFPFLWVHHHITMPNGIINMK